MGKISDMFKASNLEEYFDQLDGIRRVNTYYDGDLHIYELHVDSQDEELESRIKQTLSVYDPELKSERTQDGNPYYRVAVSGLIRDIEE